MVTGEMLSYSLFREEQMRVKVEDDTPVVEFLNCMDTHGLSMGDLKGSRET